MEGGCSAKGQNFWGVDKSPWSKGLRRPSKLPPLQLLPTRWTITWHPKTATPKAKDPTGMCLPDTFQAPFLILSPANLLSNICLDSKA